MLSSLSPPEVPSALAPGFAAASGLAAGGVFGGELLDGEAAELFPICPAGCAAAGVVVCGGAGVGSTAGGGVADGGGYLIAEGAVGSCGCDASWATSPHGNAAAKTRIKQNFIRSFIIAAGERLALGRPLPGLTLQVAPGCQG